MWNNPMDIRLLAIQKRTDNPVPQNLFIFSLDFISENSHVIEDKNMPPFIYQNIDYYETLKKSYQSHLNSYHGTVMRKNWGMVIDYK